MPAITANAPEPSPRLAAMLRLATEAGRYAMEHFGATAPATLGLITKADGSPVTEIDRNCEKLIRNAVANDFPSDVVLGEEFGETHPEGSHRSGYRWIIDPIDGTQSFIRAVPLFGCLIGLERTENGRTEMVAGVIHMPAIKETVYAERGQGAWFIAGESEPISARVSATPTLAEAMTVTTAAEYWKEVGKLDTLHALQAASKFNRGWSDCYGAVLVATARADAWVEPVMATWDSAPMHAIIPEAGGKVTDWRGDQIIGRAPIACTNGRVHEEVLKIVRD